MNIRKASKGANALEYALLIALVGLSALFGVFMFSDSIARVFSSAPLQAITIQDTNRPKPSNSVAAFSWPFVIPPTAYHPMGGLPVGSWVPLDTVTAPTAATVDGHQTIRVQVNGTPTPLPVAVRAGDVLAAEVFTPSTFATDVTWMIAIDEDDVFVDGQTRPSPDSTPDPFLFTPITAPTAASPVLSDTVVIDGMEPGHRVPVTVIGPGEPRISVNGALWTDTTTLENGDMIRLQVTAPPAGDTILVTVTVVGTSATLSVGSPPASSIIPFDFGAVTLAWNNTTWRITSPYVNIGGLSDTPMPFEVTGSGNPMAQANVPGGPAASGMVRHGTDLQIDAPPPGGVARATLTIDGQAGAFEVRTNPIPDQTITHNGQLWLWIPVHWQGRSVMITGGGNAGAAPNGGNTVASQTLPNGRIVAGQFSNGFNLVVDAPSSGSAHTITVMIDDTPSTFRLMRP